MAKQQQQPDAKQRAMQLANTQIGEIKRRLEIKRAEIQCLAGGDQQTQRLMMGALMLASDNPKIRECEPNSIVRAVIQAALCQADVVSGLGEGYLVPYFNKEIGAKECQFMPGYRLGQRLIQQSTGFRVVADVVCEKDHWVYSQLPLVVEHTPAEDDRGDRMRAYAAAVNDDGKVMFAQVVSARDIEQAKISSRKGRDTDSPAWRDWEDQMWRKVAIMRLAKETRAYRPSEIVNRLLESEAAAYESRRVYIGGELPEPRALPPSVPEEGRAKVGSSTKKPEPEPQKEAPPADAKPAEEKPPERAPLMQTMDLVKSSKSKDDLDRIYVVGTDGGQEPRKEIRDALEKRWAELQESPHDSETGETEESPAELVCAKPDCDRPARHGNGTYCNEHMPPQKNGQAKMGGAGF